MDSNSLKAFIRLISKEKDLPPEILKEAIEHAILAASRKQLSQYRDAVPNLDLDSGTLQVVVTKTAVDEDVGKKDREKINYRDARKILDDKTIQAGQDVRVPIDPSEFGRIAAQSARQMVMQRLRDAERFKIFNEYKDKLDVMVTGIVQRFERRDVIVNIGRGEATLPLNEQPMGARYKFNDRIKVLITRVEDTPKGPLIVVSRKAPKLVIELFKQEVPEIADGTVEIVGIAREAGVRTKIAVRSRNSDVDPVGACVGMKGSRVQMVVRELENEKIDIVPWSMDASTFIRNALNPAKIIAIDLDSETKRAGVTVAQGNLAIAIGRKGQNTKLAARLTGYRLDIRSENEDELAYEEIQRRYLEDFVSQIEGLSELYQEAIMRSQFNSVEKIANAEPAKLLPFTGDNEALAGRMIEGAREYMDALREMEDERRREREEDGVEDAEDVSDEAPADEAGEASDEAPADEAGEASDEAPADEAGEASDEAPADEAEEASDEAPADEAEEASDEAPADEAGEASEDQADTDESEAEADGAEDNRDAEETAVAAADVEDVEDGEDVEDADDDPAVNPADAETERSET